jgi:hypothetical protein
VSIKGLKGENQKAVLGFVVEGCNCPNGIPKTALEALHTPQIELFHVSSIK